jgi:16S rRNA (cytidine1402-2'-O)-methyltransferase
MPSGTLYVVSTPIGNLEDLSPRAERILREVHLIAAEDTRVTGKLLAHFNITTPQSSYHEYNKINKLEAILSALEKGDVALVSDAGTPLISDPGWKLVDAAVKENIPVVPVPGSSSILAALVASGLPSSPFVFWGFPPRRKGQLTSLLRKAANVSGTHIFFESPKRVFSTLFCMKDVWGDLRVVLAREVTKVHEEFIRGTLSSVMEVVQGRSEIKGELVILVDLSETSMELWIDKALTLHQEGFSDKDIVKVLKILFDAPRNRVYSLLREKREEK